MAKRSVGSRCCFSKCGCSSAKCRGLTFHRIPAAGVNAKQDEWRKRLIHLISRDDALFNPEKAQMCSRHFTEDCFVTNGPKADFRYRRLKFNAEPTLYLPKCFASIPTYTRLPPAERSTGVPQTQGIPQYRSMEELQESLPREVMPPWHLSSDPSQVKLVLLNKGNVQVEVTITTVPEAEQSELNRIVASVRVLGMSAPKLHCKFVNQRLSSFLHDLHEMLPCKGVTDPQYQDLAAVCDGTSSKPYFRHFTNNTRDNGTFFQDSCIRSRDCELLLPQSSQGQQLCKGCIAAEKALKSRADKKSTKPVCVKANDPLHGLTKTQLKALFKKQRTENKKLIEFKESLQRESITLPSNMHNDLLQCIDKSKVDDPLVQLFWEEQQKAFAGKDRGMRWHPMMIRLAILLHCKNAAAYELLRKTGVLKLPGTSTLQEYTNVVSPSEGFYIHKLEELQKAAKELGQHQRYVCLLHDEMTIKSDLVFDKRTGTLVGFVNHAGESNVLSLNDLSSDMLATHALCFFIVGLNSNIKTSIGYFGTKSARGDSLFPLFWDAIDFVEEAGFKVMVSTCDKAPQNQRLHQMHGNEEICFRTPNIRTDEDRFIYFISDPPHLLKTIRNNLASSGSGRNTKLLWNDGYQILWSHIADLYRQDQQSSLSRLPRLTKDHIVLNAHSVMNVKLAAQVLSNSVGQVLDKYGPEEAKETARLILLVDRFFDMMNVKCIGEAEKKRKPDLAPYRSINDPRFSFLTDTFLQYFDTWKKTVDARPGTFSRAERQKMFLSRQTHTGLVMTVRAFVECTKYLLQNGMDFVLSHKMCQDPLEEHFGRHRWMGRTADNPTLHQFGHHENSLHTQRDLSLMITPAGKVRGQKRARQQVKVTNSPLKKKKYAR